MIVLGLSGGFSGVAEDVPANLPHWFMHDAAAVLVRDGNVVAAVEEERLNRIKHTNKFCAQAIRACLDEAALTLADVDRIAYCFTEEHTDGELGLLYAENPRATVRFAREWIASNLADLVGTSVDSSRIVFVPHHLCHAYAAFFHSGFERALVAVIDGFGDQNSLTLFDADDRALATLQSFPLTHSLGHLYSGAIELLGYTIFDEYKVMGLAPYGSPERYREIFRSLYALNENGHYELDVPDVRSRFLRAGFRPRRKGERFSQEHMDFAAALQETLETIALHVLAAAQGNSGHRNLCIAGGVGLNCTLNGKILGSGLFERVFVHPASHDAGAAIGAALYSCHSEQPGEFRPAPLKHVFWGPHVGGDSEVSVALESWRSFLDVSRSTDIVVDAARLLADGLVGGWVQERSEFGPRALGNRSILADPRPATNRERINRLVKKREGYRPFAPSVPKEAATRYFDIPPNAPDLDYMIFIVAVRPECRKLLGAITHVDGTARIQTVDHRTNERYWRLIHAFGEHTGTPVLLNTSFNNFAEPIVQTADEAIQCFLTTELDFLVIGDWLVRRRSVAGSDYLELAPDFHPAARLRAIHRVNRFGSRGAVTCSAYFTYARGTSTTIGGAAYAALVHADGTRNLAECGLAAGEDDRALDDVITLWEQRYLRLAPPRGWRRADARRP